MALAETETHLDLDPLLGVTVEAAGRITGAGVALLLIDGERRLERLVAEGLDGCTRDTLARADVLRAFTVRPTVEGPFDVSDLDPAIARTLEAVAPHGLMIVPVGRDAFLVLVESEVGPAIDADALGPVLVLARLAASAFERARAAATLRASCEELRHLCTNVLVRQDEQLGRTAREVHEGICQRLAAANAQLEALGALVDGRQDTRACLRDARALVNQTLGELRELAQRLRPSVLENLGYVEALRWYLGRLRERAGVAPLLEIEGGETRLPVAVESALYRATEEALGAAGARGVRRLRVRYRREREGVRIEIAGPAPEAVDLVAIRERLRPFGGAVQVNAAPDRATVIEVKVPTPVAAPID